MKTDISFIVPIYNMERYLRQCLDSILMQNVEAQEIILINDGSTDDSLSICREYEAKYSFVKLIDKPNGGISSARNAGLQAASGEYICFVDSDDYYIGSFANDFLKLCAENQLDIIRGWYEIYDEETDTYLNDSAPCVSYSMKPISGREFLERSVLEHANEVVPWLGFFRREYLQKHSITFPEGIAYEEDQLFFLDALLCDADCRVMQTDCVFYAYRKRRGSATKTPTLKQAQDVLFVVERETALLDAYDLPDTTKKAAKRYICSSFYQLTSIYGRVSKKDKRAIKKAVSFSVEWECIKNPYDRHQQIKILLFTFARWIVDLVYKKRGFA